MISAFWDDLSNQLQDRLDLQTLQPIYGGDINRTYGVLAQNHGKIFVKIHPSDQVQIFEAEAQGLRALSQASQFRIPKPLLWGVARQKAFLVTSFIPMVHRGDERRLASALVQLHRISEPQKRFGWWMDNWIGHTPQVNAFSHSWVHFWQIHRLKYMLDQPGVQKFHTLVDLGYRLIDEVPKFFDQIRVQPSLLHGDLWGGNKAWDDLGNPVLFDPAVYFGHREADLAMTELFGGFSKTFYQTYQHLWPLDQGYTVRKSLYNLYHVLNHLNLFGSSYASQALHIIRGLLSEVT